MRCVNCTGARSCLHRAQGRTLLVCLSALKSISGETRRSTKFLLSLAAPFPAGPTAFIAVQRSLLSPVPLCSCQGLICTVQGAELELKAVYGGFVCVGSLVFWGAGRRPAYHPPQFHSLRSTADPSGPVMAIRALADCSLL